MSDLNHSLVDRGSLENMKTKNVCGIGPSVVSLWAKFPLVCAMSSVCGPLHLTPVHLWNHVQVSGSSFHPFQAFLSNITSILPLIRSLHTHSHTLMRTIGSGNVKRTHRQTCIPDSLPFEFRCLSLWSEHRQLDVGRSRCWSWGENLGIRAYFWNVAW